MSTFKNKSFQDFYFNLCFWLSFIDDVDILWIESHQKLDDSIKHTNNAHQSIKLKDEMFDFKISFLDTTTSIKDSLVSTDLYYNPTDKYQNIYPQSCHTKHCTKRISYNIALRVKRSLSFDESVTKR